MKTESLRVTPSHLVLHRKWLITLWRLASGGQRWGIQENSPYHWLHEISSTSLCWDKVVKRINYNIRHIWIWTLELPLAILQPYASYLPSMNFNFLAHEMKRRLSWRGLMKITRDNAWKRLRTVLGTKEYLINILVVNGCNGSNVYSIIIIMALNPRGD